MHVLFGACILVVLCSLDCSSAASRITFDATPSTITLGFTPTLTIRCSVGENTAVGSEVSNVASVVVIRTDANTGLNETVAAVTTFGPATAHSYYGKLQVTGSVSSSSPGEDAYLELVWNSPTARQHGIYICQVFTLSSGNSDIFEEALTVGIDQHSTQELLLYIADLESRTEDIEQRVSNLQGGNVQTGVIICIQGNHDYPISFSRPYNTVPIVITAVTGASNSSYFVRKPTVLSTTVTGFALRCRSTGATNVIWVAI